MTATTVIIITLIIGTIFGFFFRSFDTPQIKETLSDKRRRKIQQINLKG